MNDDEFLSTASVLNIPMNKKILKASFKLMNNYINEHAKTLVIREDIHLPEGTEQEAIIRINKRYIEKEKNAGYAPAHIVAREISSKGKVHYHMVLFVNGEKTESTYPHFENMKKVIQNTVGPGGSVHYCNDGHRNGIMIHRDNPDLTDLHEAQRQVSYLAKTDQKEGVKGKTFFTSRIKR